MTMLPLTRRPGGIQAYKLVVPAGSRRREPEPQTHGEAAEFDTRVPHWFGAADAEAVEFLSLFGSQGERAHLRARPQGEAPA
jgi:hypothetical protein